MTDTVRSAAPWHNRAFRGVAALVLLSAVCFALSRPASADYPPAVRLPGLPAVLGDADAGIYQQVFTIQEQGRWGEADRLIARLSDRLLVGHVLFQRYMHPVAYRSRYTELRDWMAAYADHPEAARVYRLAMQRRPSGAAAPPQPRRPEIPPELRDSGGVALKKTQWPWATRRAQGQVRRHVINGNITNARDYLAKEARRIQMPAGAQAESLGIIARGYYHYGFDLKAMETASEAARLAPGDAVDAHWWGGLAAWRQQLYPEAARHFEALGAIEDTTPALRSAGYYWASRAWLVSGEPARVNPALWRAASTSRGLYALLATRALGLEPDFIWPLPPADPAKVRQIAGLPAVHRAIALMQADQDHLAGMELRQLNGKLTEGHSLAVLTLADKTGLADVSYSFGRRMLQRWGRRLDAALYPVPMWEPSGGFTLDRALIYAFARQESGFVPRARSSVGAQGLMQLMPATAGYIAGRRFRGGDREKLFDVSYNLKLGQDYLTYLMDASEDDPNMFLVAAAYNGGPGNLARWRNSMDYKGDPLLFIESLPAQETRWFVKRILANLWVYRNRLGQPALSLDHVLAGKWPAYVSLDRPADQTAGTATP